MKKICKPIAWVLLPAFLFWALVFGPSINWYMNLFRDYQIGGWLSSKIIGTSSNLQLQLELSAIYWDDFAVQQQLAALDEFSSSLEDTEITGHWPESEKTNIAKSIEAQRARLETYRNSLESRVDSAIVALDRKNASESIAEARRIQGNLNERFPLVAMRHRLPKITKLGAFEPPNAEPQNQSLADVVNQALRAIQETSVQSLPLSSRQLQAKLNKASLAKLQASLPLVGSDLTSNELSNELVEVCDGGRKLMLLQLTDSGWMLAKIYGLEEAS